MAARAFDHARLMRDSLDRVERAMHSDQDTEARLIRRIRESPATWSRWEWEHAALMYRVADFRQLRDQVTMLRTISLELIEGKTLFAVLRETGIRGARCAPILRYFHRTHPPREALLLEHGRFLRASCSHLCSSYLGCEVANDAVFLDPMQRYESLYEEYLCVFCEAVFSNGEGEFAARRALLPLLKYQLAEQRARIIAMPHSLPELLREDAIRRPTGDTVRLDTTHLRGGPRRR